MISADISILSPFQSTLTATSERLFNASIENTVQTGDTQGDARSLANTEETHSPAWIAARDTLGKEFARSFTLTICSRPGKGAIRNGTDDPSHREEKAQKGLRCRGLPTPCRKRILAEFTHGVNG